MLQGNFFFIIDIHRKDNTVNAVLGLDPGHRIFEGHFPQSPVVPGVCMVQMIKEVLENEIGHGTRIVSAAHIKFLTVINPRETRQIQLDLKFSQDESKQVEVSASLFNEGAVYFKFKGLMKALENGELQNKNHS
ncbi:MAG: hypothetical protein JST47_07835 [Bacteroidetes bacterium]|nr:hypothetical protein [Bacteroidota bacterium]MBS1972892.1 hypothetical protein [Bacteroidota bacterium]